MRDLQTSDAHGEGDEAASAGEPRPTKPDVVLVCVRCGLQHEIPSYPGRMKKTWYSCACGDNCFLVRSREPILSASGT